MAFPSLSAFASRPGWQQAVKLTRPSLSLSSSSPFSSSPSSSSVAESSTFSKEQEVPLYCREGIFAVNKPLEWTSQDVVSYLRKVIERDSRSRGAKPAKLSKRGTKEKKKRMIRVGHGGTLDPLATGVLVVGVGSATKSLQSYLSGAKAYRASVELGFETITLDMEGNVTKTGSFDHVTFDSIQNILPQFTGKIMQVPPIYSAVSKNGKRLYKLAREGKTEEAEQALDAREVEVNSIKLLTADHKGDGLPCFGLQVECGGGTYIRSLVRDIGHALSTHATMTSLERIQQGQFTLEHTLDKDDWNADNIYDAIEKGNSLIGWSSSNQ